MDELQFNDYTLLSLPSGTHIFFPSLERRAKEEKGRWLTVTLYDNPPYASGSLVGNTLHAHLEEGAFLRLERSIAERDLQKVPVTVRFSVGKEGEVADIAVDAAGADVRSQSDIRGLRPDATDPRLPAAEKA